MDDPSQYPIVDVVDDGIDNGTTTPLHPDFYKDGVSGGTSRLVFNSNCTTDALPDGQEGHGNLNAGIVAAYNNLPGAPYIDGNGYDRGLGISPFGRVAGTKIFLNSGPFDESACGGSDASTVLAVANAGATITSNSWGSSAFGDYDTTAQAYDALTRNARMGGAGNQQMLHVFSAGNDGRDGAKSIGSPGTAKNVLTVGATENVRDNGILDGCGDATAANADNIADFSSRGPTTDGRIKPDIVAPGTHIQGPASQDPTYDGTGVCGGASSNYYPAGQTLYTWSSGTSHSAPAVAGVASLVYNYYGRVINPGQTPSPAMLKALILNAPRYLTGANAVGALPSPNQGWGDANLGAIFDTAQRFVTDQTRTFLNTGDTYIKGGAVANTGKPLRITLVWTDAPGSTTTGIAPVNNLDLEVTVGGRTYKGNVFNGQYSTTDGTADALNNVESVFLPAGTSGAFSVRVIAANIAGPGVDLTSATPSQDFALVISNGTIAPTAALSATTMTTSDAAPGGNANGSIDPGETIALTVGLANNGDVDATGVSASLTTTTGTVALTNATSAYANLLATSGVTPTTVTNTTPFTFTVSGSHPCGAPINLTATVSYNSGLTQTIPLNISTGASSTHISSDVPKAIPDDDTSTNPPTLGTVTSLLPITTAGNVVSLTVKLTIHHTFDPDLTITLISPAGTPVTLALHEGYNSIGSSGNFIDTVFDDAGTTSIENGTAPLTGTYQPVDPLSTFAGTPINGTWKLVVVDDASGDTGTIDQWSLAIQPSTPSCSGYPPPTATSISPDSGATSGGTTVTITGTNFAGPSAVTFGGQSATNVTVVNSTTITAVTPAHASGAFDVVVTSNGTILPPLSTKFTYGVANPLPPGQPTAPPGSGGPAPSPGGRPGGSPAAAGQTPAPLPPKR